MCVSCASGHGEQQAGKPAGCGPVDHGLPRYRRISNSEVFSQAFRAGRHYAGRYMVMWLRSGKDARLRLGVVASKRSFRKAADRSRAKRLLREAYRLNRFRLAGEVDVVLVARRRVQGVARQEVERDLLELAEKAGIMGQSCPTGGEPGQV